MVGAAVVVALVAIVVVSSVLVARHAGVEKDRPAAEAAARTHVAALLSYDSANLPPARAAVDRLTTGPFHDQFAGVFTQVVAPNATAQHARSTADVRASGVVSASPGRVVVLLFLNQSTSSDRLPADRVDTIQARVTMTEVGGTWLVAGLDQV